MAKGMILAAGQGTRVRPLTKDLPKPMVPILGKPVMEYLIEHLARHGIREIIVNGDLAPLQSATLSWFEHDAAAAREWLAAQPSRS